MKAKTHFAFVAAVVLALLVGAVAILSTRMRIETDTNKIALPSIDDVPAEHWAQLAQTRIFFGHKSVGYNIIDGITDIIREHDNIKLNIIEGTEPALFERPVFAHSQVGKNTDPISKIESFRDIMGAGVGDKVDIAFFKFCYVDIMRDSDPQGILDSYRDAIEDLQARYPETKFLHVTAPICSGPKGAKRNLRQSVKLLLGRPGILDDNMMRESYNKLLNNTYSKAEPLFDLALVESVNPAGFRCYAREGAKRVSVLVPEYTEDGGHLNRQGRKKVAEQLLIVLAEVANGF